ncbi:hypothetical protein OHA61_00770 [Streptomyces sp. NBC_00885]|uniref:hypothetical protein n=1 Tax=Streptomyces sp. NBC_00885 TaxID=2975857 RepID=UPI003865D4B3|nr:hypothetical protein OHA61_00770 [Streptomyces sp. NBC_00885]
MADIDTTSPMPEPEMPPTSSPGPALPTEPTRHQVLDVVVLMALLAVCAGVYRAVGNAGFSVIIGAVAGLYGTWRIRR